MVAVSKTKFNNALGVMSELFEELENLKNGVSDRERELEQQIDDLKALMKRQDMEYMAMIEGKNFRISQLQERITSLTGETFKVERQKQLLDDDEDEWEDYEDEYTKYRKSGG